jgi:small subunit ribosomal protein S18
MARDRDRTRRAAKEQPRRGKKKICVFCADKVEWVDYKDVTLLRRFMSDRGKIRARRVTGNCAQHQREVAVAIKTSRELALLPYTQRLVNERSRGGRAPVAPAPPAVETALTGEPEANGSGADGGQPNGAHPEAAEERAAASPESADEVAAPRADA